MLISNHHVGADALQKVSNEKTNYLRDGFYAHSEAVHEIELQRARRAQPATRQVGWPLENGLARGYIGNSERRG